MFADSLGYFPVIANLSFPIYISVYCLGLQVKIVLSRSNNFDKLASACHILFPSCGTQNEILWAQTFWAESRNGIWDFEWNLNWTFKFEPGVQFCWLLSGMVVCNGSFFFPRVNWIILDFERLYDICFQMTKLAIIPCTVLLETLFLGKRFRFHLASYLYYIFILWLFVDIYLNIVTVNHVLVNEGIVLFTYRFCRFVFPVIDSSLPGSLSWPEV